MVAVTTTGDAVPVTEVAVAIGIDVGVAVATGINVAVAVAIGIDAGVTVRGVAVATGIVE